MESSIDLDVIQLVWQYRHVFGQDGYVTLGALHRHQLQAGQIDVGPDELGRNLDLSEPVTLGAFFRG